MYIAWDRNFNRIHIKDSIAREKYFCPYCQSPLTIRKGDVRQHHYAHTRGAVCSDTWSAERNSNDCEWHKEWQDRFPVDNQEISLMLGEIKHRADVMIRRTVLEFQHSSLNSEKFSNRNAFYAGLGHKVIWVFDFRELYENGRFEIEYSDNSISVEWTRPKHTFDDFTDTRRLDGIELYFQITPDKMLRITKISSFGFERFEAKEITVNTFLNNLMESDGSFAKPEPEDLSQNPEYLAFKEEYNIALNAQQERAVQTISGANLLLAVPGSGKTTVLVSRIGFMVICKNISPQSILALTYTTKAADEMKTRAVKQFGNDVGRVVFKTINAFAYEVLKYYEGTQYAKSKMFDIISEANRTQLLRNIFRELNPDEEYPTEEDIKQLGVDITRKKNGVDLDEMKSVIPNFDKIYTEYNNQLKNSKLMDYDDQNRYALFVLNRYSDILHYFKSRYQYICVDEAQDTSKCQHDLIRVMSGDNIFMVGDEDQSIYSFRGAFPRALTDFEMTYRNPYILRMEMNYRSHSEITEFANRFVARNTMRHPKSMTANRGKGGKIELLSYKSRSEEYEQIYQRFCCKAEEETAILYRDADCGINLIAMLLKNSIPFRLLQNSTTFFTNKFVRDAINFIRLALNPYDTEAFMKIYYKIKGAKYKKQAAAKIVNHAERNHKTITESVRGNRKGDTFADHIERIHKLANNPAAAIRQIAFITDQGKTPRTPVTLELLTQYVNNISELESYLKQLRNEIEQAAKNSNQSQLTLSTIHSAKGMEFKNVVILDVNDRFIPHYTPYDIEENEDKKDLYQEERRLFYVAMTRAKDNLYIAHVMKTNSFFVDELFGKQSRNECAEQPAYRQGTKSKSYTPSSTRPVISSKIVIPSDIVFKKASVSDYTVGSIIKHQYLGKGIITDITEIKEGVNIITIKFVDGRTDKLPLESVVQSDLITIGTAKKQVNNL